MSDDIPRTTRLADLVITIILGGCVAGAWWFLVGRNTFFTAVPQPGDPPGVTSGSSTTASAPATPPSR